MRLGWLQALVVVGALSLGAPAHASEFTRVDQAERKLALAVGALDAADGQLDKVRSQNEELGHRIAALKRLRDQRKFAQDATLEKLLQQSVDAAKDLETQANLRSARRTEVERRIGEVVRTIDEEIRLLRPGLKLGSSEQRAETARRLKALLDRREAARAILARTSASPRLQESWKKYEVEIDPLDGPVDLREKADFLEDTRDKLKKKREALKQLLAEAQTEREILRATHNFRTEVGLFDEQSRSARVPRGEASRGGSATVLSASGDEATSAPNARGGNEPPADPSAAAVGPSPAPPPQAGFDSTSGRGAEADSAKQSPPASLSGSLGVPIPGQPPKQLDASALMGLNPAELGDKVDVRSLESLLSELDRLDAYLDGRAKTIRQRAKRLETDESKALGGK